jgi:hypothetical protein
MPPPAEETAKIQTQCGPKSTQLAKFTPRDEALEREAVEDMRAVVDLWHDGDASAGADDATATRMQQEVGGARLRLADALYERFASMTAPVGLDPSSDMGKKQMQQWVTDKMAASKAASDQYEALAGDKKLDKAATYRVGAMARLGEIYQRWSEELYTMPIPESVRTIGQDGIDSFCDALDDQARVTDQKAQATYAACESAANEMHVTGPWVDKCSREAKPQ